MKETKVLIVRIQTTCLVFVFVSRDWPRQKQLSTEGLFSPTDWT